MCQPIAPDPVVSKPESREVQMNTPSSENQRHATLWLDELLARAEIEPCAAHRGACTIRLEWWEEFRWESCANGQVSFVTQAPDNPHDERSCTTACEARSSSGGCSARLEITFGGSVGQAGPRGERASDVELRFVVVESEVDDFLSTAPYGRPEHTSVEAAQRSGFPGRTVPELLLLSKTTAVLPCGTSGVIVSDIDTAVPAGAIVELRRPDDVTLEFALAGRECPAITARLFPSASSEPSAMELGCC